MKDSVDMQNYKVIQGTQKNPSFADQGVQGVPSKGYFPCSAILISPFIIPQEFSAAEQSLFLALTAPWVLMAFLELS